MNLVVSSIDRCVFYSMKANYAEMSTEKCMAFCPCHEVGFLELAKHFSIPQYLLKARLGFAWAVAVVTM
jgi:hypothetical protein